VETDVAVIGSGIGGLTCAALLAKNGFSVVVCESHVTPGGAAHAFERDGYHFESGPSFFTGFSVENSANPMSQVLAQLDERVESISYDRWNFHLPEGLFVTGTDEARFHAELARFVSDEAMKQWLRFEERMKQSPAPEDLHKPFAWLVDQELSDPFLRRLCDFDAFSLSGMDACTSCSRSGSRRRWTIRWVAVRPSSMRWCAVSRRTGERCGSAATSIR
jgi:phytoene dehydrogenase-like protein